MHLTDEEKKILDGENGEGNRKAMELLVALGKTFNARRLIPISRAHVALSGQEGDTYWCELLVNGGARCKIFPTTNPSWDVKNLTRRFEVTSEERELGERTIEVYRRIGAKLTFCCAPGLGTNAPMFGEHVAFSESSATPYVNAVLGARSNRESSVSALAAAVIGKTPEYGFHLGENRLGHLLVEVEASLEDPYDWGLLGYIVGRISGSRVPVLRFHALNRRPRPEEFLYFGAEAATSGAVAMYHFVNITPEAPTLSAAFGRRPVPEPELVVKDADLRAQEEALSDKGGAINLVMLGCPQYTYEQLLEVESLMAGRKVDKNTAFWIMTSVDSAELASRSGLRGKLSAMGVELALDTCIDEPCWKSFEGSLGVTDSPKCAYYRERRGQPFAIRRLSDCIEAAVQGRLGS